MAAPSFRVGSKELFLSITHSQTLSPYILTLYSPNAHITLLRSSYGPQFAKFRVPLFFSKLDLRDYLWHVYRVEIIAVRSYVKQQRVQAQSLPGKPAIRRWHRPIAHKHMTVQLVRPFVWPEEPEDFKEWDQDNLKASEEEQEKMREAQGPQKDTIINDERRTRMREQAKLLLEGKAKWKPAALSTPVTLVARDR